MDQSLNDSADFDAAAAAAWEAYQILIWQEVDADRVSPEIGRRLCDTLAMVVWFHGYQAGRLGPLPPL